MKTNRRILLIATILLTVVAVVSVTIYRRQSTIVESEVEAVVVSYGRLTESVSGTGTLVPDRRRTVYAKASGVVEEVFVEEGRIVSEGDTLLRLEDREYRNALRRAQIVFQTTRRTALTQIVQLQASYGSTQRAVSRARRAHTNNVELRAANAISSEQLQQSAEALADAEEAHRFATIQLNVYTGKPLDAQPISTSDEAQAIADSLPEVVQAALAVEQARRNLADASPTAPETGTLAFLAVEPGSLVAPNAPLARIELLDVVNAEIQIDEVDIGKISVGNSATIQTDSLIGVSLSGEVRSIAPTVSRVGNTRVSTVVVGIENEGRTLKSGASCTVRIVTTTKENALNIPITAYITEADDVFAYTLEPVSASEDTGRYRVVRTPVQLGITTVQSVEVVEGLAEGDLLVSRNLSVLRDGMVVRRRDAR